jgi:hypothetical protein
MRELATKEQLLKNSGYSYDFDRELYLNRKLKKAFSVEFVEDRSQEEIEKAMAIRPFPCISASINKRRTL